MTQVELSVVIPTRDRRDVLMGTLDRLVAQSTERPFAVVVVDDGSRDGTPDALQEVAGRVPFELRVLSQAGRGPAAARNLGWRSARGDVVVFLGDDTRPAPDLIERHAAFHAQRPEPADALLGHVRWSSEPPPTPFMLWLERGVQFDFHGINGTDPLPGQYFYTANVSVKRVLLERVDGFDEAFTEAANEDTDLGLRLARSGMRLRYDPDAVVEHVHPTDLPATLHRMWSAGRSGELLARRHPDWPLPRRPSSRHRVKAAALTTAWYLGLRSTHLREEVWRFLCHEAHREALWEPERARPGSVRIGAWLYAAARRERAAQRPPTNVSRS